MRKIPLGQIACSHAIVDNSDFKELMEYMWHKSICGAAQRRPRVNGKRQCIFMHHEILGITGKKKRVIHVNGDRLDNRKENLKVMGK